MALILAYHRVAEAASDPWGLCVAPQHLDEHLAVLVTDSDLMRMDELTAAIAAGVVPRHAVAITFDDGYADNLYNARVLLEHHEAPATVFVATGYIGSTREYWWDFLQRILLRPGTLPSRLTLRLAGMTWTWNIGAAARWSDNDCRRYREWRAWHDPPTARHAAYRSIWQLLRPLPEVTRMTLLADMASWGRTTDPSLSESPDPTLDPRAMSLQELETMGRTDLIDIGAHTVSHPLLTSLSPDDQRIEIDLGKMHAERMTGRRVTSFAYPYGAYDAQTVALVRGAGFISACGSRAGVIDEMSEPFELPRVQVQDCDGRAFAQQLSTWFEGRR
jgi:peptidoglycan/xylan/chitin deacetylase (PgdA/CDA1 family)